MFITYGIVIGFFRRREMLPRRLVSAIVLATIVVGVSMLVLGSKPARASELVGDPNGDGRVDGNDVAMVAKAFGSYPGHPRWDPIADLNVDNKVDSLDIAIVAKNFGEST